MQKFSAGVITISDTCWAGTAIDTSGPHLKDLLETQCHPTSIRYELVPDDQNKIEVKNGILSIISDR